MIRTTILGGLLLSATTSWAAGSSGCAGIEIPGRHFIYIAGTDFRRLRSASLELGTVTLPQRRDIGFLVVTSPDLDADILPGGRDVEGELDAVPSACKRVKVSRLSLHFGSVLPPGKFLRPFPVFARKSDGLPDISASPDKLSGTVDRLWMKVAVVDDRKLVIRNDGDVPGTAFDFGELSGSRIRIVDNRCQGVALQPAQACEVAFEVRDWTEGHQDWMADYAGSKDYLDMSFTIAAHGVRIDAFNKFYE